MYKQVKNIDGTISETVIQNLITTTFIPVNPGNYDYQQYLKWVDEGNTIEPADE